MINMANCIVCMSLSKRRIFTIMDQYARYSLSKYRCRLKRELGTFIEPRLSIMSTFFRHSFICESRVNVPWRTDLGMLKKETPLFTKCRYLTDRATPNLHDGTKQKDGDESKKLSLVQKFKKMYKEYWYVLVPVHIITSLFWFGSFYYLAVSGINVAELLESMGAPDTWIEKVRSSKAGDMVVAYTLYKIAAPLRYTVSLGGTTISINYLKKWGWIKPVPNREQIKKMYQEQKGAFKDFKSTYQDKIQLKKDDLMKTKEELKYQYFEAKEGLQRSVGETKREFKTGVKEATQEWKHIDHVTSHVPQAADRRG